MNNNQPWLEDITLEDLPNQDLQIIASTLGMDIAIKILVALSGFSFAVPSYSIMHLKKRYVLKNYDGTKISRFKLAKECGLSERTIFRIYKEAYGKPYLDSK